MLFDMLMKYFLNIHFCFAHTFAAIYRYPFYNLCSSSAVGCASLSVRATSKYVLLFNNITVVNGVWILSVIATILSLVT